MNISKRIIALIISILALSLCVFAQTDKKADTKKPNPNYDAELAKKLGGDDYGMKQYVLVILKTGPTKIDDLAKVQELFAGHLKNIMRLADEGKLALAGPFTDGGNMRGLFIFNVKTIEEAKELIKTDPAIAAGLLDPEFIKWYGSAAVMIVNDTHKKIQKTSILD
jgi:uncharacterized protein YciI